MRTVLCFILAASLGTQFVIADGPARLNERSEPNGRRHCLPIREEGLSSGQQLPLPFIPYPNETHNLQDLLRVVVSSSCTFVSTYIYRVLIVNIGQGTLFIISA